MPLRENTATSSNLIEGYVFETIGFGALDHGPEVAESWLLSKDCLSMWQ